MHLYFYTSILFGGLGGAVIGFSLGQAASHDELQSINLFLAGSGLILVAIPFSINYTVRAKKAVSIYNKGLSTTSGRKVEPYTFVGLNSIGIGIVF